MHLLYWERRMGHIKPKSDLLTYEFNPSVKVFLYGENESIQEVQQLKSENKVKQNLEKLYCRWY